MIPERFRTANGSEPLVGISCEPTKGRMVGLVSRSGWDGLHPQGFSSARRPFVTQGHKHIRPSRATDTRPLPDSIWISVRDALDDIDLPAYVIDVQGRLRW